MNNPVKKKRARTRKRSSKMKISSNKQKPILSEEQGSDKKIFTSIIMRKIERSLKGSFLTRS
jgi:hypothetical protein